MGRRQFDIQNGNAPILRTWQVAIDHMRAGKMDTCTIGEMGIGKAGTVKTKLSLHILTVSPGPSLFAYTIYVFGTRKSFLHHGNCSV